MKRFPILIVMTGLILVGASRLLPGSQEDLPKDPITRPAQLDPDDSPLDLQPPSEPALPSAPPRYEKDSTETFRRAPAATSPQPRLEPGTDQRERGPLGQEELGRQREKPEQEDGGYFPDSPFYDPGLTRQSKSQKHPRIADLIQTLQSPDSSDEQRAEARTQVAEVLRKQFDEDLANRRRQLEELEKQLTRLRHQLQNRGESRDKLVELRLQLLENEASGLGFPASWSHFPGSKSGGQTFYEDRILPPMKSEPRPPVGPPSPARLDDFIPKPDSDESFKRRY